MCFRFSSKDRNFEKEKRRFFHFFLSCQKGAREPHPKHLPIKNITCLESSSILCFVQVYCRFPETEDFPAVPISQASWRLFPAQLSGFALIPQPQISDLRFYFSSASAVFCKLDSRDDDVEIQSFQSQLVWVSTSAELLPLASFFLVLSPGLPRASL